MDKTKICKKCREQINKKVKKCPHCGSKQGVPTWLVIIIVISIIGIFATNNNNEEPKDNNKYSKNENVTVTMIDLSTMTEAEINIWCNNNKINCSIKQEYSNSINKDRFISQSISSNKIIYEGDKIEIIFSLGKEPTIGQKNALKKAESYSSNMHMSKSAIYKQLISEYGEGFTKEQAQYAIDNLEN